MNTDTGGAALPWSLQPPALSELREAAARLRGVIVETPLLESERLNRHLGGRILVKAEGLQHTGSFKLRGAWNYLFLLSAGASAHGLVALSSGNHGQAVAWAARRLGLGPVVVLMPRDTPQAKVERTRGWGAEVFFFDRTTVRREDMLAEWTGRRNHHLVPAYDDRRIIAGAGTIALETIAQATALGAVPEMLVVACSGGGLSAGCALALLGEGHQASLLAVEPEGYDDMARSLLLGHRVSNEGTPNSICDALLAIMPGVLPFAVHRRHGTRTAVLPDSAARAAVATLFAEFGLVAEPGAALPLGALLTDPSLVAGRTVCIVVSGRNTDPAQFAKILREG